MLFLVLVVRWLIERIECVQPMELEIENLFFLFATILMLLLNIFFLDELTDMNSSSICCYVSSVGKKYTKVISLQFWMESGVSFTKANEN